MRKFAKQADCPAAAVLTQFNLGALPALTRQSVARHLATCDFCAAEARLLARHAAAAAGVTTTTVAPPVPLAVRLLAQTLLEQGAARAATSTRRAA
ncbi:MAG TPA: hypothetical protein VF546_06470 [Pyrinomonadaceae bacterium]|jgi:anti-sigma factor RsiW